ncbi:hypothetical protein SPBR_09121 [Sporothrix brasiliensis 5110]|uniref:Ankyrin repeat protein n=1 Tax=Sporothrix brasiliensis 5110 TaxID=1398154 RepID=A0A0C2FMD1_9PEZI|nr:uncharacterized protein SPBR_09121 [Sporothrix brasiliensis 5110]KIH92208.1 hypothetical protein SPBR_09121 [Sporothrix brasiliensis 5110]
MAAQVHHGHEAPDIDTDVDALRAAFKRILIKADDLPAMRELIRLEPDLLRCEWPGDMECPPMVLAARLSRHAILDLLMKHRATLPPEMRVPPVYEDDNDRGNWGTPLTEACAMGRLDTVRLLLQGMPETDINEVTNGGFTPLIAAAHGHSGPPEARVELIRYLLERGADIHAIVPDSLAPWETLDKAYDKSVEDGPYILRPRPGGRGNVLVWALNSGSTAPAVVALLVEAGVSVYQSYLHRIQRINKTDDQDVGTHVHLTYDRAYLSPIATGAMYHDIDGVKALLNLFPTDHERLLAMTDAVLVPQPPAPLRDPDDEVPVLLPLHAAVIAVDMVRLLTADKDICAATINARYRRHYTALHMATSFDRIPLMVALVELGADIEVLPGRNGPGIILALFSSVSRVNNCSYTHEASQLAYTVDVSTDILAVLTRLLQRYNPRGEDANVDAQNAATRIALVNEADTNGNTPLHFAMAYRMPRSAAALLALGARANAVNKAGQVPYTPPPGQEHSF